MTTRAIDITPKSERRKRAPRQALHPLAGKEHRHASRDCCSDAEWTCLRSCTSSGGSRLYGRSSEAVQLPGQVRSQAALGNEEAEKPPQLQEVK